MNARPAKPGISVINIARTADAFAAVSARAGCVRPATSRSRSSIFFQYSSTGGDGRPTKTTPPTLIRSNSYDRQRSDLMAASATKAFVAASVQLQMTVDTLVVERGTGQFQLSSLRNCRRQWVAR